MKNNRNHDPSGRPTRGSFKPIEKTKIKYHFANINTFRNYADLQTIEVFREEVKNATAIYLRHAAKTCGTFIKISNQSKKIISEKTAFGKSYVCSFIDCCISYYNGDNTDVICVDLTCPQVSSKDPKKAFAQARENSKLIITKMVEPILQKMECKKWANITKEHTKQYKDIGLAVQFMCKYISELYIGSLPKQLRSDVYKEALELDQRIGEHYCYIDDLDIYQLKKQCKHTNSSLKQECATLLFCRCFKP